MQEQDISTFQSTLKAKGYGLRLAVESDTAVLRELMKEYFAELGLDYDPEYLDKDLAEPMAGYESGGLLVVERQGKVLGCAGILQHEPGVAELKRMYLRPDHRGGGLGKALLVAALSLARELGFKSVLLDTRLELKAANRLYEKIGFKDTQAYGDNPRAQRFMVKEL